MMGVIVNSDKQGSNTNTPQTQLGEYETITHREGDAKHTGARQKHTGAACCYYI